MPTMSLPPSPSGHTMTADVTATHCPYCALQCAQALTPELTDLGQPGVRVAGRAFPTNEGGLCQKGWSSASVLTARDRITTPLLRDRGGRHWPTTWDHALDYIARRVGEISAEYGRDAVAVFGGGGLTNEKAYQLGKFARIALGTKNIDYNGRFCMSSAAAASNRALGMDRGLPFPVTDLQTADVVLLLGSNVAETMPPFLRHLAQVRQRGGLVVVDPRRSATAALTGEGRGTHLQPVPGTDLVVLLALLHIVLAEEMVDRAYVEARTSGLDDAARLALRWWPERAEQVCGIPADSLRAAARQLGAAAPANGGAGAFILTGRGVEQSRQGTATVNAAINLALSLGLVGRVGSGYGALTGQGNGQGGREHGQKADQLPGYRMIEHPAAREHVAAVWGVDPASLPGKGLPAVALLAALGTPTGPKGLFVHGSNLVVSAPNAREVTRRLSALDLLVVCDFVPSETALLADVILPVPQWAEEEGTMTSLEGRVIRRRKALDAPDGVRSELWIWRELARRLGAPGQWSTDPSTVFDELARASAGGTADYSGISHARLDAGEEIYWPCPATPGDDPHPGTPRPFLREFPTADGRARFVAVEHLGPADDLHAGAPTYLVTGRVLAHYQSGAQTRRVAELNEVAPSPVVQMHPVLAARHRLVEGDWVRLSNTRGAVVAQVSVTADIRPDTVFMAFHWAGEGSVNLITSDATDPVSGMPEFKVCAVAVDVVPATKERAS